MTNHKVGDIYQLDTKGQGIYYQMTIKTFDNGDALIKCITAPDKPIYPDIDKCVIKKIRPKIND